MENPLTRHDDALDAFIRSTVDRRTLLRWITAGVVPASLLGCGGGSPASASLVAGSTTGTSAGSSTTGSTGSSTSTTTGAATSTTSTNCALIPEETAGPYPGDGSNANSKGIANVLQVAGVVRRDIRASFGSTATLAQGVPVSFNLQLVSTLTSCAPLAGYAIYLWHCDRDGHYSMYDLVNENYLRGVQETDASGKVSFTSIFPGCYSGRMPHVHFEIYPTLAKATSSANKLRTSQFAFPNATCNEVYATSGYATSAANFARISFATDNVFSDGTSLQMTTVSGNPSAGYVVTLTVAIAG